MSLRPAASFLIIAVVVSAIHWPVVTLPFFWDEAGYFVPIAHQLLTQGTYATPGVPNTGHPPTVMLAVAAAWWTLGDSPLVARSVMLAIASIGLLGVYKIARLFGSHGRAVSCAALCAVYPVSYSQSSLVQLDMSVAVCTIWTVYALIGGRVGLATVLCCVAAALKGTGFLNGFVVAAVLLLDRFQFGGRIFNAIPVAQILRRFILAPLVVVAGWMLLNKVVIGHWLGDSNVLNYNMVSTASSFRLLVISAANRVWHLSGHMGLWAITIPALPALWAGTRGWATVELKHRKLFVVAACVYFFYGLFFTIIGGAVLARYVLPATLIAIVCATIFISTYRPRLYWLTICFAACVFVSSNVIEPSYHTALEDGSMYLDFVQVHRDAAKHLENREGSAKVLTHWPATDELMRPYLGYVRRPLGVVQIESMSTDVLANATQSCPDCLIFDFNTGFIPSRRSYSPMEVLRSIGFWQQLQAPRLASESGTRLPLRPIKGYSVEAIFTEGSSFGIIWAPNAAHRGPEM